MSMRMCFIVWGDKRGHNRSNLRISEVSYGKWLWEGTGRVGFLFVLFVFGEGGTVLKNHS